jgi:hypothetical protein
MAFEKLFEKTPFYLSPISGSALCMRGFQKEFLKGLFISSYLLINKGP